MLPALPDLNVLFLVQTLNVSAHDVIEEICWKIVELLTSEQTTAFEENERKTGVSEYYNCFHA